MSAASKPGKVYVRPLGFGEGWGVFRELDHRAYRRTTTRTRAIEVGRLIGSRVLVLNNSGKVEEEFSGL